LSLLSATLLLKKRVFFFTRSTSSQVLAIKAKSLLIFPVPTSSENVRKQLTASDNYERFKNAPKALKRGSPKGLCMSRRSENASLKINQ